MTFFQQHWAIYQKIVQHDYMAHQAIAAHIRQEFAQRKRPGKVIDLGCGDAALASWVLTADDCQHYHGVDLSAAAIAVGMANLRTANYSVRLEQADLADCLRDTTADVILAGYSIHHLQTAAKARLLQQCRQCLQTQDAVVLFYDVFCRPDESREQYFNRYQELIRQHWPEFTIQEQQLVLEHIQSFDYPETTDTIARLAQQAGFTQSQCLYQDTTGIHCLMRFS